MPKGKRFPFGFIIAAGLLLLWAQFASSPQSQRITYSEFKQLLYNDKIDSVLITENAIRGVVREDAVERDGELHHPQARAHPVIRTQPSEPRPNRAANSR